MKKLIYSLALVFCSIPADAWNGEDADSGAPVEIEGAELLKYGDNIQFRLGESEEYKSGTVISVFQGNDGNSTQLMVRDEQFGDVRQFTME